MGEVPEDSRKANITPIFRKGKQEDPGNSTPASLTLIPGKVTEQLILETTSMHMTDKKILRSSRHGFTQGEVMLDQPDKALA